MKNKDKKHNPMKKVICLALTICLAAGLWSAAAAERHLEGRPWVNPELPGNLPDARPALEDDYYLSVNYDLHQQAAASSDWEVSQVRNTETEMADDVWAMVNTGESTEAKALRILTGLILDRERRDREGLEPLMPYVRRVRAAKTVDELSALCREEGFLFGSPYATFEVARSESNPEKFALSVYFNDVVPQVQTKDGEPEPTGEEALDKKWAEEALVLMGWDADSAKRLAQRVAEFQVKCASGSFEYTEGSEGMPALPTAEQILKTCTPLRDQLISQGMLPAEDAAATAFNIPSIESYDYLGKLYRDENLDLFQAFICLSMYRYAGSCLDVATYAGANGIDGEVDLKAAADDFMRDRAYRLTEQAYAVTYISRTQRAQVKALAEECRQAMADRLLRCEWLSEESRNRAAEKAMAIRLLIVTPEEPADFEPLLNALSTEGISLLQAVIQHDQTDRQLKLAMAGKPYDRGDRYVNNHSMLQANAVYEPATNTFIIMAGILRPNFYDGSSRETLLASIGQTIAHEISHGFEVNGIMYDKDGNRLSWTEDGVGLLTEADMAGHRERSNLLADSLSRIEVADGLNMDGKYKLMEASADLMGMQLLLDLAAKTEGFDYDLLFRTRTRSFFRAFNDREEAMSNYASDLHPCYYVRTNFICSQFDEFYSTYPAVQEGRGMYFAPENRVRFW